jgi:hypothetical protein
MDTGDRPPLRGRAAILAVYEAAFRDQPFRPMLHNHVIELDGDAATGTVYLDLRATMDGVQKTGIGYYEDRYVRTPEGWKFRARRLTLQYFGDSGGRITS